LAGPAEFNADRLSFFAPQTVKKCHRLLYRAYWPIICDGLQGKTKTLSGSRASAVSALLRETAGASSYKRHLYGASRASTFLLIAFPNGLGQSKKNGARAFVSMAYMFL
jgi:hypothetical protein